MPCGSNLVQGILIPVSEVATHSGSLMSVSKHAKRSDPAESVLFHTLTNYIARRIIGCRLPTRRARLAQPPFVVFHCLSEAAARALREAARFLTWLLCRLQRVNRRARPAGWFLDGMVRGRLDKLLGRLQCVTRITRAVGWILDGLVRGRLDWLMGRLQRVARMARPAGWIFDRLVRGRLDRLLGRLQRVTRIAWTASWVLDGMVGG